MIMPMVCYSSSDDNSNGVKIFILWGLHSETILSGPQCIQGSGASSCCENFKDM